MGGVIPPIITHRYLRFNTRYIQIPANVPAIQFDTDIPAYTPASPKKCAPNNEQGIHNAMARMPSRIIE